MPVNPSSDSVDPLEQELIIRSLEQLGQFVRAIRKSQNLAIDDAAGLLNISQDSFSRLERGIGGVGSDRLLTICDGLGLELVVRKKRSTWR